MSNKLVKHITEMIEESSGLWSMEFIYMSIDNLIKIAERSHNGDVEAGHKVYAIATLARRATHSAPADRPMCLLCETQFSAKILPEYSIITTPVCDSPNAALVHAVCSSCAARHETPGQLKGAVVEVLRHTFLPGARRVDIHAAGHA